ncbi:MAG TPA: hypothetical protein VGP18_10940 [Solirubrobacteraceae bacterium]|jgi:hypothetical protein|nr:hypothetical protein [Solirubrobacteraceae bacterium]
MLPSIVGLAETRPATRLDLAQIADMRPLLLIASDLQDNVATQCLWDGAAAHTAAAAQACPELQNRPPSQTIR